MYQNAWRKRKVQIVFDGGMSTAPRAKPGTAKATANPRPPSCPVTVYPLPNNVSPLEQAVADSLSQQKTERVAERDHGVNSMTLGEACKRALYVATKVRWLELIRCHSQYHGSFTHATRHASAKRKV